MIPWLVDPDFKSETTPPKPDSIALGVSSKKGLASRPQEGQKREPKTLRQYPSTLK